MNRKSVSNPFEYEAANNLSEKDIIDFYIEDYSYTRFIRSTKNVFLVGERGSGKTMTLLYNSFPIQYQMGVSGVVSENQVFEKIGIHVPCNTPLFHKKEYLLIEAEHKRHIICEHFLVLSILFNIAKSLDNIPEIQRDLDLIDVDLLKEIKYVWNVDIDFDKSKFFNQVKLFVNREIRNTQLSINTLTNDSFYDNSYSFSSLLLPFFDLLRKVECLSNSHFLIMIDDAHDMNEYQIQALNSWIAYRDHSLFSFKVAVARVTEINRKTSSGGSILEGHDYITIEMGKNIYSKDSDYYQFAKNIIDTRIKKSGLIGVDAESFFPFNSDFIRDIEVSRKIATEDARKKGISEPIQITEYVKKYHRAVYFQNRPSKANNPPYSGFETLVDISTGIIRNLLDPCYWMYDKVASDSSFNISTLTKIDPATQNAIIQQRSQAMWAILMEGLDKIVPDCNKEEGIHIYRLFDKLMILFKKRLFSEISEPRAIVFALTEDKQNEDESAYLYKLIDIAKRAQMLYTRIGSGKQMGTKIVYYVPNRILLPDRGLDVKGQYSQVHIKTKDLYHAIVADKDLPFFADDSSESKDGQFKLNL